MIWGFLHDYLQKIWGFQQNFLQKIWGFQHYSIDLQHKWMI